MATTGSDISTNNVTAKLNKFSSDVKSTPTTDVTTQIEQVNGAVQGPVVNVPGTTIPNGDPSYFQTGNPGRSPVSVDFSER